VVSIITIRKVIYTDEYLKEASELNYRNSLHLLKNYVDKQGNIVSKIPTGFRKNMRAEGILVKQARAVDHEKRSMAVVANRNQTRIGNYLVLSDKTKKDMGISSQG